MKAIQQPVVQSPPLPSVVRGPGTQTCWSHSLQLLQGSCRGLTGVLPGGLTWVLHECYQGVLKKCYPLCLQQCKVFQCDVIKFNSGMTIEYLNYLFSDLSSFNLLNSWKLTRGLFTSSEWLPYGIGVHLKNWDSTGRSKKVKEFAFAWQNGEISTYMLILNIYKTH